MKRVLIVVLASALLAVGLACGGGPESCGRKDISRVVHKDGHTIVQKCKPDANGSGLHWETE